MALEHTAEQRLRNGVKKLGGFAMKIVPAQAGAPDRLVFMPGGRIYLVEMKSESGKLRPIQKVWHARVARRGTTVVVLHGRKEVDQWLRKIA